jgi:RsiW-degrading membrane proteinase PrsW (M82 family)
MLALTLGGSAIVPSLLLLWYIYSRDRNPEPGGLLMRTFVWGTLICLPVIPLATALENAGMQTGLQMNMWGAAGVKAFLGAAVPEELLKFLVLMLFIWPKPDFDEPMDGVVYGAAASLGFATLENVLYVSQYGLGTAVLRAVTAVPGHAFTGVVMGAFVGRARFAAPHQKPGLLFQGLFWAVVLHGLYDMFLMTESGWAVFALAVLFIEIRWGRQLIRALRGEQDGLGLVVAVRQVRMMSELSHDALVVRSSVSEGRGVVLAGPPQRSAWGWIKLWSGALGLTACGLWWLGVMAVVLDTSGEPGDMAGKVGLVLFSLVPTFVFFRVFRSGLNVEPSPALAT